MGKRKYDFQRLATEVLARSIHDAEGPAPRPETHWNVGYAQAIEQGLEQGNYVPLIRMLDAGLPIHPIMLPALADAIRSLDQGRRPGKPRALTSLEEDLVVSAIIVKTRAGQRITHVQQDLAEGFGVSFDTIKRAWAKRHKAEPPGA